MSPKLSAAEQSASTLRRCKRRSALQKRPIFGGARDGTHVHTPAQVHMRVVSMCALCRGRRSADSPRRGCQRPRRAVSQLGRAASVGANFPGLFFAIFFPGLFDTHSSRTRSVVLVVDKTCCDTQLTHSIRIPTPTRRLNNRDREDPWYSLRGTDKD
jgi:hypothetical protein